MQVPFRHPLATHSALDVLGYRRNGTPIYAIAGGSGEGDGSVGSGGNSGDGGQQQSGDQGGAGGAGGGGDTTDWKAMARQWEQRAKENKTAAEELAALKQQNMSDQEKAIEAARTEGRTAALAESAPTVAQARLEAAAARAGVDLSEFAEFIDLGKFVKDGAVDNDAIKAAVDKFSKLAPKSPGRSGGDFGGSSGDQSDSLDKQIADAEAKRDFATAIRLKRLKAAQTT